MGAVSTRVKEVFTDLTCIGLDTRLTGLHLSCTVHELSNEVSAFIRQTNIIRFTDFSSRNKDGLPSILLLSNGVTALANTVNGDCLYC